MFAFKNVSFLGLVTVFLGLVLEGETAHLPIRLHQPEQCGTCPQDPRHFETPLTPHIHTPVVSQDDRTTMTQEQAFRRFETPLTPHVYTPAVSRDYQASDDEILSTQTIQNEATEKPVISTIPSVPECITGYSSCENVGNAGVCCPQKENDTSSNTCFHAKEWDIVVCCDGGEDAKCSKTEPIGTCPQGFFPCQTDEGGNCCKDGYSCSPDGCTQTEPKFTTTAAATHDLALSAMMTDVPVVEVLSMDNLTQEITLYHTALPFSLNATKISYGVNTSAISAVNINGVTMAYVNMSQVIMVSTMTSSSNPMATSNLTKSSGANVVPGDFKPYYMAALTIIIGLSIILLWH